MNEKYSPTEKETSEKRNLIKISNSVLHRLTSGVVDQERFKDYENNWIDKLAAIDKDHTTKNGLDINEAEKILNDIDAYISTKSQRNCPIDTIKVTDCLKENKGNTLTCEPEVANFKQCIDKSLHDAVSKNMKDVRKSKKESYTETFERKYQF